MRAYNARESLEVAAIFGHHIVAFLVVVFLSIHVCCPWREVGNTIQGPMSFEAIDDLVPRGRLESLFVGGFESINRTLLGA
jgi:hypothetical protein